MKYVIHTLLVVGFIASGITTGFGTISTTSAATQSLPSKVKNLHVVKRQSNKVALQWNAVVPHAKRYQVRVMNKKSVLVKKITIKQVAKHKKKVKVVVQGLKPNTVYKFRVRAKGSGLFGKYSKRVKTRTNAILSDTEEDTQDGGQEQDQQHNDDGNDNSDEGSGDEQNDSPDNNDEEEQDGGEVVEMGIPYGFWGLNGFIDAPGLLSVQDDFNSTVFQVASTGPNYTVNTLLPLVRDAGMSVTLRMTSQPTTYFESDFDLDQWKTDLDRWDSIDLTDFIEDGTLVGHMLLDDIHNYSYVSGSIDPTAAELDEMARYSEEKFPGLLTYVRENATDMPVPLDGTYADLDAIVNQYNAYVDGDITTYATVEVAKANELNVGSIQGLNIVDGGNGDSGVEGSRSGRYAMTAAEIAEYGETLLSVDNVLMFLMWEYDGEQTEWLDETYTYGNTYFDEPALQQALYNLGIVAAEYPL